MKYDNLKQELTEFLSDLNKYSGVGEVIINNSQEHIKEYWEVVELCREVKKKMEWIYERY
jgi:tRNA G37 N-methylase Trm5